ARRAADDWLRRAGAQRSAAPPPSRFKVFRRHSEAFLKRSKILLESGADSQPGFLASEEASRRIKFFVNSLFIQQPDAGPVIAMPAFSTLTPYYNEDVVLSLASLKQETEDGVTVLEYLRTIYPGEWDAFLERMADTYGASQDVIEALKLIIYNTSSGGSDAKAKVQRRLADFIRSPTALGGRAGATTVAAPAAAVGTAPTAPGAALASAVAAGGGV
ncbi:unnamed protein product, partial [Phaeothamnion confervicola]